MEVTFNFQLSDASKTITLRDGVPERMADLIYHDIFKQVLYDEKGTLKEMLQKEVTRLFNEKIEVLKTHPDFNPPQQ